MQIRFLSHWREPSQWNLLYDIRSNAYRPTGVWPKGRKVGVARCIQTKYNRIDVCNIIVVCESVCVCIPQTMRNDRRLLSLLRIWFVHFKVMTLMRLNVGSFMFYAQQTFK